MQTKGIEVKRKCADDAKVSPVGRRLINDLGGRLDFTRFTGGASVELALEVLHQIGDFIVLAEGAQDAAVRCHAVGHRHLLQVIDAVRAQVREDRRQHFSDLQTIQHNLRR